MFLILGLSAWLMMVGGGVRAQSAPPPVEDARFGVLMIFGSQTANPSNTAVEAALRAQVDMALTTGVDLTSEYLDLESNRGPSYAASIAKDLEAKYRTRNPRVIVAITPTALKFVLEHRHDFAPGVPVVYTSVSAESVRELAPPADVIGVTVDFDLVRTLELALRLHPKARTIVMPVGGSEIDRLWKRRVAAVALQIQPPVPVAFLEGLSYPEMQRQLGVMDEGTVIFVPVYRSDSEGRMFLGVQLIESVAIASRAPLYTIIESGVGLGAVGGYVVDYRQQGKLTGEVVTRILQGTAPTAIANAVTKNIPTFDARQLARWQIDESLLPQGSVIKFRQPGVFEQYRWHIVAAAVALLLQAAVIGGLLLERRRRRAAEGETRKRFAEMAHMNRSVSLGALSGSIAHEINQPLGAIMNNAGAAELLMAQSPPALSEIIDILGDIKRDNQRASDVIARIRTLLRKDAFELRDVDLNQSVIDVAGFLGAEASIRGVTLIPELDTTLRAVRADVVQLQQVITNLVLNGMDAMRDNAAGTRNVVIRTSRGDDREAEVTITDTGTGIDPERLVTVFDPFYTTKPDGMGLGLSISRTIVEAHHGTISARNGSKNGVVIRFTIPFSTPS